MSVEPPAASLELRAASYDSADAQLLTAEVQQEYVRRYGGEGDTAPVDTSEFDGDGGRFFMVYVDDVPAAMGGWRRHEPLVALHLLGLDAQPACHVLGRCSTAQLPQGEGVPQAK